VRWPWRSYCTPFTRPSAFTRSDRRAASCRCGRVEVHASLQSCRRKSRPAVAGPCAMARRRTADNACRRLGRHALHVTAARSATSG
jgi:ribosomal protein L37E